MIAPANRDNTPEDGQPSLTEGNGRGANGRFLPGNRLSKGNPYTKRINQLRSQLLDKLTDDRMENVAEALIQKAEDGDLVAIRDLFDRIMGKPVNATELGSDAGDDRDVALPRDVLLEMIRSAGSRAKSEGAA